MTHPAAQWVPILDVAAALGLQPSGRMASCFNGSAHKSGRDAKPALAFFNDSSRFKCFACGVKGDSIDLVKAVLNVPFKEAVAWLAKLAGKPGEAGLSTPLTPTPQPAKPAAPQPNAPKTPSEESQAIYLRLYELSHCLDSWYPGGAYVFRRGIDLDLAIQNHVTELGDPEDTWDCLTKEFGKEALKAAGLVTKSGRFLFSRHHLLLFYFADGRPQFVVARDVTGKSERKELSLAGVHSPVPYLSDVLKQGPERVLVCEGCFDALAATQLGFAAVGVPGVQGFQQAWFDLFKGVGRVTILFDNDDAGRRESVELRSRFRLRGFKADASFPAQGKDINDLLLSLTQETVQ